MNLIRNNDTFDEAFNFQDGVQIKNIARLSEGGTVSCLDLEDKHGNLLRIQPAQYSGIDIYTRQQVKRYKLHGYIDGCKIEQLFDSEEKANDQLRRFQDIGDHGVGSITIAYKLQVEEILVADN